MTTRRTKAADPAVPGHRPQRAARAGSTGHLRDTPRWLRYA
jgi:hypothetical protein